MKSLYLSLGLIMAAHACPAATSGTIGVKLTISRAPCLVSSGPEGAALAPTLVCRTPSDVRPKISETRISQKTQIDGEKRIMTVEW